MGNGDGADGTWMEYLHPTQDVYGDAAISGHGRACLRRDAEAAGARLTLQLIPIHFATLCLKRFIYFWAGPPKAHAARGWR